MDPLTRINTRRTPQDRPADSRQTQNSAGGYTFEIDDWTRLNRFLVLGTDGGTYYSDPGDLTRDNADVVLSLARSDGSAVVNEIVQVSRSGRAPKQNPTLFALAAVAGVGDDAGRKAALDALSLVARTGTHLFLFARYVEQFRGWGRGLRTAVGRWYLNGDVDRLQYQVVKYRQREGWTHRDLLRLAHPDTDEASRARLFDWVCGRDTTLEGLDLIEGYLKAQEASTPARHARLVEQYGLTWEMLPDSALGEPRVWEALIRKGLPQTALMRQLPRLTKLGLLSPLSETGRIVAEQLVDGERLRKARVHPVNVLVAQRTYASGSGARGSSTWNPERQIVDALDTAFYRAFGAVEPTGKRTMLALDVSGSMSFQTISGMPLTPREASAALALVTASVESSYEIVGFTGSRRYGALRRGVSATDALSPLSISPRQRLDDAINAVSNLPFGGTDCALPMVYAKENRLSVDTFVVYTDNETWAGGLHPHQALREYRDATGIDARLVVVGMTATRFSIADPSDAGMLDVAGFDSAVPTLISDFSRGDV